MKSKSKIAKPVLETMSFDHLRGVAKNAGLKIGKTKQSVIDALLKAIDNKTVHFKSGVTMSANPVKPGSNEPTQRMTHFGAVFRTYLSGPGQENQIVITPDNPVAGSPYVG